MRKWNKRILGILLCGVLVIAMVVPALAFGDTDESSVDSREEQSDAAADVTTAEVNEADSDSGIFRKDSESGDWYYYIDGEIAVDTTDVIKDTVGTIGARGDWWNVVKGKVTPGETVARNDSGWWYIDAKGMVDFSYIGFAKNDSGVWYCENGKVTFQTNGVFQDANGAIGEEGAWWYVIGSKVQTDFTGLADYSNAYGWWYIENGTVDFTANTVAKNKNGWYCVRDGKVDPSYNGFAENDNGKWYVRNGTVTFDVNSVLQDTDGAIGEEGAWWYVIGSKVQTGFTGLANYSNAYGWWYIDNGAVDFTANTVAKNQNGWYCVRNGGVDFSYTGFAENDNGKWYVQNGTVTFYDNSVLQDTTGAIGEAGTWWYVVGSKVQTGYTGLANYSNAYGWWYIDNGAVDFTANTVAKNKNGWYCVRGGKADFSYTGFAENNNGIWYVENGVVTLNKNSVIQDSTGAIGNAGSWWYVVGSKVQTGYTGLANYSNANGLWYIQNGQVDFTHNGVEKNNSGWWYVVGGKVQTGFTGLANYGNANGWWYIKNGAVDFSHSGLEKNNNGWYYVSGGKVNFSFNGLASNSNGMWVVQNGAVNFNYNGSYTYSGVTYTVTNGKATPSLNGMSSSMYNKAQSQSSSTRWLIMVDIDNCKLGVLQGSQGSWAPVKYWTCSTGAPATPTVRGTYSLTSKGKSFGDGFTCWYYNQFYGNYLIHSILYNQGSMTSIQDGRLGEHVSHGCVRLALENAKWIYDNVPIGSRVVTY